MSPSSAPLRRSGAAESSLPTTLRHLALIFGLALLVRALVLPALLAPEHALAPLEARELAGDARLYHLWATELAEGRDPYAGGAWWHAPLFPLALARVYALCGPDPRAALALQVCCGLASLALLYFWARRAVGGRAALAAAALAALYLPSSFFESRLLPAPLATLLAIAALWAHGRAEDAARPRLALAATGVLAGLAALARPNLLPLVPALALLALRRPPRELGRGGALLALLVGSALPLGASFARNAAQGEPALICSNGGLNLWLANHADATPQFRAPDARWTRVERQEEEARAAASEALGSPASASAASRFFAHRALDERLADPAGTAALLGRKLLAFFSDTEAGVFDLPQIERELAPALWAAPLPFALLLALAAVGALGIRAEERRRLAGAALLLACGIATALLFFGYSRLRLPTLPLLFALGGAALTRGAPARPLLALLLAALAVFVAWPDREGVLELRRSKIEVEQVLRRLAAAPPPERAELARLAARLERRRAEEPTNELVLGALALLAERRSDPAPRDEALRALAAAVRGGDAGALADAQRTALARLATPGCEAALRGSGPRPSEPLLALSAIEFLEALRQGAREESARAALDLRLGFVLAQSVPGGDPARALDRALEHLHAALRHPPRDEREARELTAAALYFRGGTYDQIAALPARREQRDQLLALALRDYYHAAQTLYGDPPSRALELAGPALALGYLGKERAAHGVDEGRDAARYADRVLDARRAAGIE